MITCDRLDVICDILDDKNRKIGRMQMDWQTFLYHKWELAKLLFPTMAHFGRIKLH